jgi:shikimate dehydrogenase
MLDFDTEKLGVIGYPLKHSLSPLIHNNAIEILGLNYQYQPIEIKPGKFDASVSGLKMMKIKGFNVTIPYKEQILSYLDETSKEVNVIGAANTIVNIDGKYKGYNTDAVGIKASLDDFANELKDSKVIVLGAGGASRAVIYSLIEHFGVSEIHLFNRTKAKAEKIKSQFSKKVNFNGIKSYEFDETQIIEKSQEAALIINTTPIGMHPDIKNIPINNEGLFQKDKIYFDLIYNPLKTEFLKKAGNKGAVTINGLKMFVGQAAEAFKLWTGKEFPIEENEELIKRKLLNL